MRRPKRGKTMIVLGILFLLLSLFVYIRARNAEAVRASGKNKPIIGVFGGCRG